MNRNKRIIYWETTQFDFDFIMYIQTLRKAKKITQQVLSTSMGLTKSFVGKVESLTQGYKYSTRHIPLLAKVFGMKKLSDIMQFPMPEYDKIIVTMEQDVVLKEGKVRILKTTILKIEEKK